MILAGLMPALFGFAQSTVEEIDYIQSIYGMEKKVIVAEFVQPENVDPAPFWEVYDEYEIERKNLGKERIALLEEFGEKYEKSNGTWIKAG